jgi:cytoskeletal protein RodZ
MRAQGTFAAAAAIRESRGILLEEIARTTRIGVPYLRAIEAADFKRLPGGVYNVSYIRQYARATGADEDELVSAYFELTPEAVVHKAPPARGALERVAAGLRSARQRALAALARLLPQ